MGIPLVSRETPCQNIHGGGEEKNGEERQENLGDSNPTVWRNVILWRS